MKATGAVRPLNPQAGRSARFSSLERFLRGEILLPALFRLHRLDIVRAMEEIRKEDTLGEDSRRELQFERLRILVNTAFAHSHAYRCIYEEQGFHPSQLTSWDHISEIPPVDRPTLQRFSHDEVLTHQVPVASRRQTTGTTGQPLDITLDRQAYATQLAARFVRFRDLGIHVGDREARFWGRTRLSRFAAIRDLILGRKVVEVTGGHANKVRENILRIASFRPRYFYGYASMLVRAAQVWAQANIERSSLAAIISTGETLQPFQKTYLEEIFGCPVINEYGSSEADIIGFECLSGRLHLETHNVLVESVPSKSGDKELLITNLQNRLMPLIRYSIGDSGEIQYGSCECGRNGPWLSHLRGRSDAQLIKLPNGETRHCIIFTHWADDLMLDGVLIRQYRIIQEDLLRFTLRLEIGAAVNEDQLKRRIQEWTRRDIDPQAVTDVVIGPILVENGGKFTDFVALRDRS